MGRIVANRGCPDSDVLLVMGSGGDAGSLFWDISHRCKDFIGFCVLIASGPPNAPAALLLPSMAATATLWQPNVAALSRYFRTYAIDVMAVTMMESARPNLGNPRVFSKTELRAVRAPTLLLIGEHERLYDAHATLRFAQECMPGLTGVVIPNAPHLAAMAQPEDVNERIIRFLRGIALATRSEAA